MRKSVGKDPFFGENFPYVNDQIENSQVYHHNYVAVADMHMMVSRPEQWVKPMAAAGANQYTFHLEATSNPGNLIKEIRESGMKVTNMT